jgi:hypothetical protein
MKLLLRLVVLAVLTISAYPQTTLPGATEWSAKSKKAAEDAVAGTIEMMRVAAQRPALKRVNPSIRELELVCTAAVTGHRAGDPIIGGLTTYETDDLSVETDALKEMIIGKFYPEKKWPRYSVIVERKANSGPEKPVYAVGVVRRPSGALEFFAPLFFDVPFKGMNDWKKQVAPECRDRQQ